MYYFIYIFFKNIYPILGKTSKERSRRERGKKLFCEILSTSQGRIDEDYLTHHEYSRLTNTSLGLSPTTYFLSVRFWRLSKVSIPVFGSGTLPTPGVFPRKVWTIQSPWMSPLYLSSLNGTTNSKRGYAIAQYMLRLSYRFFADILQRILKKT